MVAMMLLAGSLAGAPAVALVRVPCGRVLPMAARLALDAPRTMRPPAPRPEVRRLPCFRLAAA